MNVALGFTLTAVGLLLFASGLNKTTGAMLTGLLFGEGALTNSSKAAPSTPISQSESDALWKDPFSSGGSRAGVVPIAPGGGIPGITVPIIPNDKMG